MKTSILIKSFNRAFYLDRCLKSIKTYVTGNYKVTILDDGTPQKYLDKIQELHPEVTILKSENYKDKEQAIKDNLEQGKEINGFQIPTKLWRSAAQEASEYFIMTEDDVWFTENVDIDQLRENAKKHNISLLKLGWLGNTKDLQWVDKESINDTLDSIYPKDLFLSNPLIMDWFFYNKFKFFSLLFKLKLVDNETPLKYWALNSILMGFWKKEYWLYIWKDSFGKVNEKQQLRNASVYYRKHRNNRNFIAHLKKESMKTTFQSSATNSYHSYGFDFDVNLFNHLINEAWLAGEFDALENFPKDFSTEYFETFIKEKINIQEFRKWTECFKNQYRNLGCEIE
ncbi:MAG: glycosyltransferase family 2 protein [Flavobacteriaceae bacterium]|nr:glycosyltransferase family 2 protein [Flavobacteriaceae bacterium]